MGMTKKEFDARKLARREAESTSREEQAPIDYAAIAALEDEKGIDIDTSLSVRNVVVGVAVVLGVRMPSRSEYKRYSQRIHKAATKGDPAEREKAGIELADVCWVYPAEKSQREQIISANPATLTQIGTQAASLAELENAEEGKG